MSKRREVRGDPVEPELMYRCADYLARSVHDLLGWLGVED